MILNKDGRFGFAGPYIVHKTLKDLVLHYKDNTLADHNSLLETTLKYPVNSGEPPPPYASTINES